MGTLVENNSGENRWPAQGRARMGDKAALSKLFTRHRDRLRRMGGNTPLDWRLQARLDASDVIQDAFLEVAQQAG